MEKKKILGKILPAILVVILAVLLVIVISSCSKSKKTPTGLIEDDENYIKLELADGNTYSVSKLDFYNKLRYAGYDEFEQQLYGVIFKEYVDAIKADLEANASDLSKSKYYDKFVYIIDQQVYGETDKKKIEEFEEDELLVNQKQYLNNIKSVGADVDGTTNIYQKASLEYQIITLAKREYARSVLLKDVEEIDGDYEITDSDVEKYFEENVSDKGDLDALLILFSSETETKEALMQLNLKFYGNKVYRVFADEAEDEDESGTISFDEYKTYYDKFDNTKDGVSALNDTEVLFEFCRVYNYIYGSYRQTITLDVDGDGTNDLQKYDVNPLATTPGVDRYSTEEYKTIANADITNFISQLVAQDKGDFPDSPRITYTYDVLHDLDETLTTSLYSNYLFEDSEKTKYNNPSSTFANGNYLVFKLRDASVADYDSIKTLDGISKALTDSSTSKDVITAYVQELKEEFKNKLKALNIYDDNEKICNWAKEYANEVKVLDVVGASNILKSCQDKEGKDSIWAKIFEGLLTDEYINDVIKEYLEDNCKITIYDSLFEAQFAQKFNFYSLSNKSSKEYAAQVVIKKEDGNKEKLYLTVSDLYDALYKKYGANEALQIIVGQVLKEKYYNQITKKELDDFEKEYNSVLSYFAAGNTAEYGYDASIGQKAFIQLYFKAENKDEAIFNMWVISELNKLAYMKNPEDIYPDVYSYLKQLTDKVYDDFANIEYRTFIIYTDDDEDGKPDDWSAVDDSDSRKQEVQELAAKLFNIINDRLANEFTNTDKDTAYNSLLQKYQSSSRISHYGDALNGDAYPTAAISTSEINAYYFAAFKAKGLYVSQENTSVDCFDEFEGKDLRYVEQIQNMYKWMITNQKDNLTAKQVYAVKAELNDEYQQVGGVIDKASKDNLFFYDQGYAVFYIVKTTKQNSFKFEFDDNEKDDVNGKVYPYAIDVTVGANGVRTKETTYPLTDDDKSEPYDNIAEANTLYNDKDKVTANQIMAYIYEYTDGVESLSVDVTEAFETYFDAKILNVYSSQTFQYQLSYKLIEPYLSTVNSELQEKIKDLVDCKKETLFDFKEANAELETLWWSLFN